MGALTRLGMILAVLVPLLGTSGTRCAAQEARKKPKPLLPDVEEVTRKPKPLSPEAAAIKWPAEKVEAIEKRLRDEDPKERIQGLNDMQRYLRDVPSAAKKHIPMLVEMLKSDPDGVVRADTVCIFADNPNESKAATDYLISTLKDEKAAKTAAGAWDAYQALGLFKPPPKEAVPALIGVLKDGKDINYVCCAAGILKNIGPDAKEAATTLVALVRAPKGNNRREKLIVRGAAMGSLFHVGASPNDYIPAVVEVLRDGPRAGDDGNLDLIEGNQRTAAAVLRRNGARAKAAIPAIIAAIDDKNCLLDPDALCWVLGKMGPDGVAALAKLAESSREEVSRAAIWELGKVGADSVPALVKLLDSKNDRVREKAIRALWVIGPGAEAALPRLQKIVEKKEPGWFWAESALKRIEDR
jgi:HEAT repeat protein